MFKKILLFSFLIIFIPVIIVSIFIADNEIKLNFSSSSVVRVYRSNTNTIESVPIEEYVLGVISSEMPITFNIEALKAQAVASRSYVMRQMERNINNDYDVVDTVSNQVYKDEEGLEKVWKENYEDNINKAKKAVIETKGQYLEYNGKVAETLFFSTSSGYTENSEDIFSSKVDYLRSVESKWDSISKYYEYTITINLNDFYNKLDLKYNDSLNIEIISKTVTGRPKIVKINGVEFKAKEVCSKLNLKSSYFIIKQDSTDVIITTKGYGHGVGMSQYGAEGMAREGYNYEEILNYYYNGTKLKTFK